jgi:hypothetical protein
MNFESGGERLADTIRRDVAVLVDEGPRSGRNEDDVWPRMCMPTRP